MNEITCPWHNLCWYILVKGTKGHWSNNIASDVLDSGVNVTTLWREHTCVHSIPRYDVTTHTVSTVPCSHPARRRWWQWRAVLWFYWLCPGGGELRRIPPRHAETAAVANQAASWQGRREACALTHPRTDTYPVASTLRIHTLYHTMDRRPGTGL